TCHRREDLLHAGLIRGGQRRLADFRRQCAEQGISNREVVPRCARLAHRGRHQRGPEPGWRATYPRRGRRPHARIAATVAFSRSRWRQQRARAQGAIEQLIRLRVKQHPRKTWLNLKDQKFWWEQV